MTTSSARDRVQRNGGQRPSTHQEKSRAYGGFTEAPTIYNERGELATSDAKVSGATVLGRAYTRDKLGRIDTVTETTSGGSVTRDYDYDLAGRLVAVTQGGVLVEEYSYDANGNRISSSNSDGVAVGTFDAQDRVLTYGAHADIDEESMSLSELRATMEANGPAWRLSSRPIRIRT